MPPSPRPPRVLVPPVYLVAGLLLMELLHRFLPGPRLVPEPWNRLGLVAIGLGCLLALSGAVLFHRQGTAIHPFAPSSALVVSGPYRLTRNPMYLGLTLVLVGVATLHRTATPWLVVPAFVALITVLFVRKEEAILAERFGEEYEELRRRVRRWI